MLEEEEEEFDEAAQQGGIRCHIHFIAALFDCSRSSIQRDVIKSS